MRIIYLPIRKPHRKYKHDQKPIGRICYRNLQNSVLKKKSFKNMAT